MADWHDEHGNPHALTTGIEHLTNCPGCDICDSLIEFYETCDECGAWGHMDAMGGYVKDGMATCLCSQCLERHEQTNGLGA